MLLSVVFDGRFSPVGVTAAAQAASDRGIPAGAEPSVEDETSANKLGLGAVPGGDGGGDVVDPDPGPDPDPDPPAAPLFLITAVACEVAVLAPKAFVAWTMTLMR